MAKSDYSEEIIIFNEICRLCYNEKNKAKIKIYSENLQSKINKYLYLQVSETDDLPKTICAECYKKIEEFHSFSEKINETQRLILKDRYDSVVLKAIYHNSTILLQHGDIKAQKILNKETDIEITSEIAIPIDQEIVEEVTDLKINEDSEESDKLEYILGDEIESVKSEVQVKTPPQIKKSPKTVKAEPIVVPRRVSLREKKKPIKGNEKSDSDSDYEVDDDDDFEVTTKDDDSSKNGENLSEEEEEIESNESETKRKRGRPKGISKQNAKKQIKKSRKLRPKRSTPRKHNSIPMHEEDSEGDSENEFPARDSDNEDWPAQTTLDSFPVEILENGLLLVKGKKLMNMICKFYKLECDLCEAGKSRFRQLRQLFDHIEKEHKEDGYVTCCQTKLGRYPAIIMHMARHLQPSAFKCDICGYMVTRPRFLDSHKQTHLPEDQKPFACEKCPRRFCWKGALQIHLISHQPVDERKLYVCHVCGKSYDTPGGLSTHKKVVHTDKKQDHHVCHVCAKTFATRTGLNEHMATIHQPREKDQVQCTECGKWLMNIRCLKSHMTLHSHLTYNCNKCTYSTKKQLLLKRHLLSQHSEEKPHTCQTCGKTYKLKRALTIHVATHNTTKSFNCTFCDRVFASSTNFYTHRKNMHPFELQAMKEAELEEQRQKRIKAGIEEDNEVVENVKPAENEENEEEENEEEMESIENMENLEDIQNMDTIIEEFEITSPGATEVVPQLNEPMISNEIIGIQSSYTGINGQEHHIIQTNQLQPMPMVFTLQLLQPVPVVTVPYDLQS